MNNTGLFSNGHKPWNKGIKGLHHSIKTEFKKGQIGINWVPIGTVTIRTYWNSEPPTGRRWIKIANPNKWKKYSIHILESGGVRVPSGMIVHHKDFNCLNDAIGNLMVLTRTQHINIHRKQLESARGIL